MTRSIDELMAQEMKEFDAHAWNAYKQALAAAAELGQPISIPDLMRGCEILGVEVSERLVNAFSLILHHHQVVRLHLDVYHSCTRSPVCSRAWRHGFQPTPFICGVCDQEVCNQEELTYKLFVSWPWRPNPALRLRELEKINEALRVTIGRLEDRIEELRGKVEDYEGGYTQKIGAEAAVLRAGIEKALDILGKRDTPCCHHDETVLVELETELNNLIDECDAGDSNRYIEALPPPHRELERVKARLAELETLLNTPVIDDFMKALPLEAAHQVERWGVAHDAGKTDADWFWLLGHLAGKAMHPDQPFEKQLHHLITSAAMLLNWYGHKMGARTEMRPGINPPESTE